MRGTDWPMAPINLTREGAYRSKLHSQGCAPVSGCSLGWQPHFFASPGGPWVTLFTGQSQKRASHCDPSRYEQVPELIRVFVRFLQQWPKLLRTHPKMRSARTVLLLILFRIGAW